MMIYLGGKQAQLYFDSIMDQKNSLSRGFVWNK